MYIAFSWFERINELDLIYVLAGFKLTSMLVIGTLPCHYLIPLIDIQFSET
jgi:hypothetical protein